MTRSSRSRRRFDRLAQPPSAFGVFLSACEDGAADVFTGGRKMRVNVSPAVDLEELKPGQEVVLNEALNVVIAQGYETAGEVVMLKEDPRRRRPGPGHRARRRGARGAPGRAAAQRHAARRRLAAARAALGLRLRAHPQGRGRGADPGRGARPHLLRHRRPRPADRADPRRDRAAVPARRPVPRAPAAPAQGRAAVRAARLRQDPDRQGRGELPGQAGHGEVGGCGRQRRADRRAAGLPAAAATRRRPRRARPRRAGASS